MFDVYFQFQLRQRGQSDQASLAKWGYSWSHVCLHKNNQIVYVLSSSSGLLGSLFGRKLYEKRVVLHPLLLRLVHLHGDVCDEELCKRRSEQSHGASWHQSACFSSVFLDCSGDCIVFTVQIWSLRLKHIIAHRLNQVGYFETQVIMLWVVWRGAGWWLQVGCVQLQYYVVTR